MKIVYFDCIAGISGDMTLGAFINAGTDLEFITSELKRMPLPEFEIKAETVNEHGIAATRVTVAVEEHREAHAKKPSEIIELISSSSLPDGVKDKAIAAFKKLAIAEAKVHGVSLDDVHLHEVGATDAIIDIVGTMLAMHQLCIERAYSSCIPYSTGLVKSSHGTLPLPAPAALELLKGAPWRHTDVDAELVTPTGAAILSATCESFGIFPMMSPIAIGYGAGHKRLPIPNLLRIIVGETAGHFEVSDDAICEQLLMLETNIDDMPAEWFGHVVERLLELGALDAYILPAQMKKGRPAAQLNVLCRHNDAQRLLDCIFGETTTLGVRIVPVERVCIPREIVKASTPFGEVRVKVARWRNKVINISPEYEDCKAISRERGVPLKFVVEAAIAEARKMLR
ncbi:MAG: nickel pincer cofactor biosynthesis protein LarC [Armatimonadota bacterium]|nr:nickel pincer cofactor biosynthesis protein LarC [Armatimonadota bacterium]MDW8025105.1 nickel pincer cofactor biosynthesis protein LarC [Armatimonadota bacterium]